MVAADSRSASRFWLELVWGLSTLLRISRSWLRSRSRRAPRHLHSIPSCGTLHRFVHIVAPSIVLADILMISGLGCHHRRRCPTERASQAAPRRLPRPIPARIRSSIRDYPHYPRSRAAPERRGSQCLCRVYSSRLASPGRHRRDWRNRESVHEAASVAHFHGRELGKG